MQATNPKAQEMKEPSNDEHKFFLHARRLSGHEATIVVDKGKDHRNMVFAILSSGGKIISNKKVKPFPEPSVQDIEC
jgi:hypothetical protein